MKRKKQWMITKSIKFCPKKLKEAKKRGRLKELGPMCRVQLDLLIAD